MLHMQAPQAGAAAIGARLPLAGQLYKTHRASCVRTYLGLPEQVASQQIMTTPYSNLPS